MALTELPMLVPLLADPAYSSFLHRLGSTARLASCLIALLLAPVFLACPAAWADEKKQGLAARNGTSPTVVASITPVNSLATALMKGVGKPELLIRATASPHSFTLRPSDARALAKAELIFWIGGALETSLKDPIAALGQEAKVVTLLEAPGLTLLPTRDGGIRLSLKPAPKHKNFLPAPGIDPHIWLSVDNARAMARAMAAGLIEVDPAHRSVYQHNLKSLLVRLDELEGLLHARLRPVRHLPFIVFHDAYQYFEREYGLNALGSLSLNPERQPGARRVQLLRHYVKHNAVECVFSEPQFEPALVDVIIDGTSTRTGELDPLGASLPSGHTGYFRIMDNLARDLSACLTGGALASEGAGAGRGAD
jgi:zinc transport system substrate-binding protein